MSENSQELLKQQYDSIPYPKIPIEDSPKENYLAIVNHNLINPYYLAYQKVTQTNDKVTKEGYYCIVNNIYSFWVLISL